MSKVEAPRGVGTSLTTARDALKQVADVVKSICPGKVKNSLSGDSFVIECNPEKSKVVEVAAGLAESGDKIVLKLNLVSAAPDHKMRYQYVRTITDLKAHSKAFTTPDDDNIVFGIELEVRAQPLCLARANALLQELECWNKLARDLQEDLPSAEEKEEIDLESIFEDFPQLVGIRPPAPDATDPETLDWARQTMEFAQAGMVVAIPSKYPLLTDFALAHMARIEGPPIASCTMPQLAPAAVIELCSTVPGMPVIQATSISMGSSVYEVGHAMNTMLDALESARKTCIFTGSLGELQSVFSGGQGGRCDPLKPVLRRVPEDVPVESLIRFCASQARGDGLSRSDEEWLRDKLQTTASTLDRSHQLRLLPYLAGKMASDRVDGIETEADDLLVQLCDAQETLGGLPTKPRVERQPHVQERFGRLRLPKFKEVLNSKLFGQDEAITELTDLLASESVRPTHQPLRYLAQGTTGTGKSSSAQILADYLEIPYVNIDAAAISDYRTFTTQLLGAGRGIVSSNRSGRLEQAGKEYMGAVVEVSDLDHAKPDVRQSMVDMFLKVLDQGEMETSNGAMFSCADVIFVFTMNLPGGRDERVHSPLGFVQKVDRAEIADRVCNELTSLFNSSAFLGRAGAPIVFSPLDDASAERVLERGVRSALSLAAEVLKFDLKAVQCCPEVGSKLLEHCRHKISFGARALIEHARLKAAPAFISFVDECDPGSHVLHVDVDESGELQITESHKAKNS